MPKVSICLPNLNHAAFLGERLDTIIGQSFEDWECIVYDSYSDDGSWEIIREYSQRDARFKALQGPREGIYPAWNRCIEESGGQYVYIATSDDTMAEDCLEKMVAALDAHPECGIAHCALRAIGDGSDALNKWWQTLSLFAQSSGELKEQAHIRRAPFDALLQFSGYTVYISITQLLIRRELFNRIGLFDGRWGPAGDFHWHMRACLATDTIHVPSTWGGWRLHSSQSTTLAAIDTPSYRAKIEELIDDALRVSWKILPEDIRTGLESGWRRALHDQWEFDLIFPKLKGKASKAIFMARETFRGSSVPRRILARKFLGSQGGGSAPHHQVIEWLRSVGRKEILVPVQNVLSGSIPGSSRGSGHHFVE